MRELAATVSALRWTRILPASAAVSVLTFAFIYQAVYVFVSSLSVFLRLQVSREQLDPLLLPLVGGWGARVFFLLMTIWLASWTARNAGELFVAHGMAVGLLAAVGVEAITQLRFPPVVPGEALAYLAFGAAGGYLGGRRGRAALAGQEALYRASVGIGAAEDPTAIAAAVGENLYDPAPHSVTLWRVVQENGADGGTFEILASWTRARGDPWPAGDRLNPSRLPTLSRVAGRPFVMVRAKELPDEERETWERRGIRSALLVPLDASGGVGIGLLAATFRRRRLSRAAARAYLTAGAQAALALENLRLVEEARRAGRQKGVLLERQRLAHEIHDTLAQGFASIVMNLTAAEMARPPDAADAEETKRLEDARRTARESLAEARRLVWALRPEALDRHPLPEALERLAEGWSEETGVEARAEVAGTPRSLLPEVEVALLRAAQEALANARKHARAGKVNVTLSYVGDLVILDVLDDGVGFDAATPTPGVGAGDTGGFGLVAMRERVEQLGGTLLVESTPGEGTTLVVELPAAAKEPDAGGIESLEEAR